MATLARRGSRPAVGGFWFAYFWRQPGGRVSCAISPGGTYFGPLSRCARHSTRPGAQLLRFGGPPPRAEGSHIELQLVAKYVRLQSQCFGASCAAERRTLHRDWCALRGDDHSYKFRHLYRAPAWCRGRGERNKRGGHHPAARWRELAGGGRRAQPRLVPPCPSL